MPLLRVFSLLLPRINLGAGSNLQEKKPKHREPGCNQTLGWVLSRARKGPPRESTP